MGEAGDVGGNVEYGESEKVCSGEREWWCFCVGGVLFCDRGGNSSMLSIGVMLMAWAC